MGKGQHRVRRKTRVHTKKAPQPGLEYWEGFLNELSKERKSFFKNEPICRHREYGAGLGQIPRLVLKESTPLLGEHIRS